MSKISARPPLAQPPKALYASRVRVYPMAVDGLVRRFKWGVLAFCLGLYYLLPWLRWNRGPGVPNQAMLLDLWNERFYFFDLEFWPQDIYILTGLLILGAVALFLVTSLVGRAWCGFACPQTVWTDLFMLVERYLEGDRNERMRRDAAPLSLDKAWRKVAKHAAWLFIAFWTGGAWIMYYVDAPTVTREFWTGTVSPEVYFFTFLFTGTTYALAGWAREQVCTYMCPWPRFQSAMLDEQTFVVTYEAWRGEPRGHGKRNVSGAKPLGDCIDCRACVNVCPTGIDIRDGVQLECISCGLCIDACNSVMQKSGGKPWLITWDTLARQNARKERRSLPVRFFRPRTIIYLGALLVALGGIVLGLAIRNSIGLSALHDRAPLFVRLADGGLRNAYTIKVANKATLPVQFELTTAGLPGAGLILSEADAAVQPALALPVGPDTEAAFRVLVQGKPDALHEGRQQLDFVLRNPRTGERTVYHSQFLGPHGTRGSGPE
jgi:cytochrome c oxidase accessory protein FixG